MTDPLVALDVAALRELAERLRHRGNRRGTMEDQAFIAAANPQTVLALLDRLDTAEAALERAQRGVVLAKTQARTGVDGDVVANQLGRVLADIDRALDQEEP